MPSNPSRGKVNNVARSKPKTESEVISIANRQIWQDKFRADYDQIVKRISTAPFQGLRNGQPLGSVI